MLSRRHMLIAALGLPLSLTLASGVQALSFVIQLRADPVSREKAEELGWPKGALDVVNHPSRTQGWNRVFSGSANDVYVFGYRLADTREANQLLRTLRGFEKGTATLHVMPDAEFRWNKDAPEGHQASFSLGSQTILDQWSQRLSSGKLEVAVQKDSPKAMPPKLFLYVGGGKIELQELAVPPGVRVVVPTEAELRKQNVAQALIDKLGIFAVAHAERKP